MYDCHYDLLTYIYINKDNTDKVKKYCDKIFNKNIEGGIFNLFYMSKDEMKNELNIEEKEINLIENVKEIKRIINENEILPQTINYKIGIEGLDYLEKLEDISTLYKLGVRTVNIVWNNHNKFGTGVRPYKKINKKFGLTKQGEKLVKKLIENNIAIDLAHSDVQTFWDIIEVCKKNIKQNPKVWASHSNCKEICDVPRNLSDEQIKAIKELNGIIGIVSIKTFCKNADILKYPNFNQDYIEHINYMKQLLGNVDNIALATDDMSYYDIEPEYYQNINVFKQENVDFEITELLKENNYSNQEIEQIKSQNYLKFWLNEKIN